jgi:hypothetical protein
MRIAITVAIAAALILARGLVKGMVVPGKTVPATETTSTVRSYDLDFGQVPESGYCPGRFGRVPGLEVLLEPC